MFYQKLMTGEMPFIVKAGDFSSFPEHRHYEIEVHYVISGEAVISIDGKDHPVSAGDAVFIGSMRRHSVTVRSGCRALMLEFGPAFLYDSFNLIADAYRESPFLFGEHSDGVRLRETLSELIREQEALETHPENAFASKLAVTGLLYRFCSFIVSDASKNTEAAAPGSDTESVEKAAISKALDIVHARYAEKLTLDEVSEAVGYGKSNFCKLFKSTVGVTFHAYLNGYRVRNAGYLLKNTDIPLSEAAEQSGFSDQKTFCRVFSAYTGSTPGKYRKNK